MEGQDQPQKMSFKTCITYPDQKGVTWRSVDMLLPDDDVFDVVADVLHEKNVNDVYFRQVTEHFKNGKTLDVYVGFGVQEVEHNKTMSNALFNYFDTDEGFDVFGPCVVFALYTDDIPVDFTPADFSLLFFGV
jgi:hypothetical protein